MNTKLLIFDMDGTIIDSENANFYAYSNALKEIDINITRDFFENRCFYGQHYTQFLPEIMIDYSMEDIKKVHRRKQEIYKESLHMLKVHPYILDTIINAKGKYYVALGTSAAKVAVENVLKEIKLENAFDYILSGDDIGNRKPHPECFIKIMKHFNISANETVIFEDSDIGIEAAKRSGAWVIKVEKWFK